MNILNEERKNYIQREAKEILERFSKSLAKVKLKEKEKEIKKSGGFREEGIGMKGDEDFRKRIFANAPKHNEDSIIAEKKEW